MLVLVAVAVSAVELVSAAGQGSCAAARTFASRSKTTSSSSIGAVADQNHEGVNNARKKGAVLFLSFVPLSPETSAAGVRTRAHGGCPATVDHL